MSRRRYTPDDKTALLEKFLASGTSAPAFCHAEGIGYQTFQKWRRKPADRGVTPDPPPEFIQVELGSRPIPQRVPSVLVELELGGGLTLRIRRDPTPRP